MSGISVVIPAYNRKDLLPATLKSLLAQTVSADEILVVDDGSTDGTAEVAESFGPPVRVIRQINSGPGAARNRGFKESRGEFIHFFDSDDIPALNKQEIQLTALEQSGADIAISPWVKGSFQGGRFTPENHVIQQKGLPSGDLIKRLLCDWTIVPQSCLFRRTALERIDGFPPELFVGEDQLLFLRLLLSGAKVIHSPDTLTLYRTDNSMNKLSGTGAGAVRRRVHWAKFLLMAREECQRHHIDPAEWRGFRQRVWAAARDLENIQAEPEVSLLSDQLLQIIAGTNTRSYLIRAWLRQKYRGLQQRIMGRRGSASLRMGPASSEQWKLTNEVLAITRSSHP